MNYDSNYLNFSCKDPEKEEIFKKIVDLKKIHPKIVIECPPSSGKTTTSARMAKEYMEKNEKMVYLAPTHNGINEFVEVLKILGVSGGVLHVYGKNYTCPKKKYNDFN